jgi:hypothetical protein
LRNAKCAGEFIRAYAILAVRQKPNGGKPLLKRDWRVLEDCADLERELRALVLAVAFPDPSIIKIGYVIGVARWAMHHAIWPPSLNHELAAVLEIAEKLYRFQQRFGGIISVRHGQYSTLHNAVCQVLYLSI